MNLLFISDNYLPEMNANARIVSELSQYWSQNDHQVTVITSHPNFPAGKVFAGHKNVWHKTEVDGNINVVRVKTYMTANKGVVRRVIDFLSFMVTSFLAGLKIKNTNIVIAISPQFFTLISGCFVSIIKCKPFVIVLCDLWPDVAVSLGVMKKSLLLKCIKKCELWLYRRASVIACLSPYYKKYLTQHGIAENKIFISISGVDTEKFFQRPKNTLLARQYNLDNKFVVGYIGTVGMSHEFESILIVAKQLQNTQQNDIAFIFIGEGAQKQQLIQRVAELKLANVMIKDSVPGFEMPEHWSLIDVALVALKNNASNKTVIPSKMLEAMAMAKPVILHAPEGEAKTFVELSGGGSFVPMGQTALLQAEIIKFYQDKSYYNMFASNASLFSQSYTRKQQAHNLIERFKLLSDPQYAV